MKIHATLATVGATATIGAGAFLLPAIASPQATTHTLSFTAVTQQEKNFTKTSFGEDEKDLNKAGKVVGFDTINGLYNQKTKTAKGGVTLSTAGGFLYGTLDFSNSAVTHGKVTGGTGQFKGATGTIVGKDLNKAGTRTAVTIVWHR